MIIILMDILLKGSFHTALNVKKSNHTDRYCVVNLRGRPLHVLHVFPFLAIIPDNLITCIRCFKLSDGMRMMSQITLCAGMGKGSGLECLNGSTSKANKTRKYINRCQYE